MLSLQSSGQEVIVVLFANDDALFILLAEQEYLVGLEVVANGCRCGVDSAIAVNDGANSGVNRCSVCCNNACVTTHDLKVRELAGHATVLIGNEALGTNTNGYGLIGYAFNVENVFVTNVELAALNLAVEYVNGRSTQELCNEQIGGVVMPAFSAMRLRVSMCSSPIFAVGMSFSCMLMPTSVKSLSYVAQVLSFASPG